MEKKINKLVIIGNGFDLAHGFKTSYNDFMLWYLNNCISIFISTENYKDALLHLPTPLPEQWEFSDKNQKISNISSFKILFERVRYTPIMSDFLERLINNHERHNWVDIENDYYQALIKIYDEGLRKFDPEYHSKIKKLNNEFECLRDKLEEYLTLLQKELIDINQPDPRGKINNLFQNDFYCDFGFPISVTGTKQKIVFLNFNYTNTVEKYLAGDRTSQEIIYIHGQLNNPANPIIFGFGDEVDSYYEKIENLKINEFLDNFKSFWYFKTDNYQNLLKFIDSEAFDIEILGHSCGLSDRVLLSTVFQHKNCQTIKIHYHLRDTGNDFFSKTQEISRHFRDKAKMRKVIVDFSKCQSINDI